MSTPSYGLLPTLQRPWRRFLPCHCQLCHSPIAPRWQSWQGSPHAIHARSATPVQVLSDYGVLCVACLERFYPRTTLAALHAPVAGLDYVAACVSYAYPWDQLLIAFKLRGQSGLARFLACLMQLCPDVHEVLQHAQVLIPMPLHPTRLAERGYNQSSLIARALPRVLTAPRRHLPLDQQSLVRARATAPQRHLSAQERAINLRHAFVLDPWHSPHLRGKHVVLIDDILTTGHSLQQCALSLAPLGLASLSAVVVARALSQH